MYPKGSSGGVTGSSVSGAATQNFTFTFDSGGGVATPRTAHKKIAVAGQITAINVVSFNSSDVLVNSNAAVVISSGAALGSLTEIATVTLTASDDETWTGTSAISAGHWLSAFLDNNDVASKIVVNVTFVPTVS